MMIPNNLLGFFEESKFFIGFGGALWTVFGGWSYLKAYLSTTKDGIAEIKSELVKQTTDIVRATDSNTSELKSLREDMRLVITAMMHPLPRARAAKAARHKK